MLRSVVNKHLKSFMFFGVFFFLQHKVLRSQENNLEIFYSVKSFHSGEMVVMFVT